MLQKNYILHLKNMSYVIFDPSSTKLMIVKMKEKSFQLNWKQTNVYAYSNFIRNFDLWYKRLG